ncbi:helix-turn-helix domain-containing protein [Streptomyces sp. WM6386]|uniref:helix-turn-helix domain-containing protein n=1 Tax=Streptomyces sp. WM6386 TaxID=1415558 RepID=UPI00061993B6|nr:helix-turn-helix transcriptional regulator [Streptomyces sp. WM6386]KKD05994.1 DNA-binding protein [Streptomyces sp. WM6386]
MSERDGGNEVAEFAALLTRLKERTDRSYGQLARRLHMNTSTLHRYCAGDAVPVDFAPVERFAALCGATAEERLELHRLWLPAVAARQRPRTPVAEAGPAPVPEPAPDPEPAPWPAPEPESVREAQPEAEPEPVPQAETVTNLGDPSAPLPWYRRRRILVTTAVAVASAATLAGLSALSNGRSSPADAVRPSDPAVTTSAAPRSPDPTASKKSASPSPSPDRTSPSPSAGTGGPAPAPSGKGPGSPTGGAPPGAAGPLTWTVNPHVWNAGCGHHYVIDKPTTKVPPPPTAQDAPVWASTLGALHGGETMVQISVQGRSSTAVVLEALRVRVVGRAAPAEGNSYAMDNGCGGALTPRQFSVDLDADRPVARSEAGSDGENEIPAIRMPYRVSAEDPEILLVTARTVTCDCRWYLELDWSSQGRTGTARITDNGSPFRTTGDKKLPQYSYDWSNRRWASEG